MKVYLDDIRALGDFFTIVHHIPGRIRIRAKISKLSEAKKWAQNTKLRDALDSEKIDADIQDLIISTLKKLSAIKDVKVNKIIGSAIIEYDQNNFAPQLWENWVKLENLDFICEKFNELAENL